VTRTLTSLLIALLLAGAAQAQELAQPWCLVRCGDGLCGSGTVVDKNEKYGLVVTASHVVRDIMRGTQQAGTVRCEFLNHTAAMATVVSLDTKYDLCALVIQRPNAHQINLGAYHSDGDIRVYGFPHAGPLQVTRGRIVNDSSEMFAPGDYYIPVLSTDTISGQSGGAVVDDRGKMIGVMWGSRNGARMTCGKPFSNFMAKLTQYYSCQNGNCGRQWQPSQYYSPGGKKIYEGGQGQSIADGEDDWEPVQSEEPASSNTVVTTPELLGKWETYINSQIDVKLQGKECECDHVNDVTKEEFEELQNQVSALSESAVKLSENVSAIAQSNATINQTIQQINEQQKATEDALAQLNHDTPTPEQQAEAILPYLPPVSIRENDSSDPIVIHLGGEGKLSPFYLRVKQNEPLKPVRLGQDADISLSRLRGN
jgi:hypothetical protein